ncbi:hypothetical protein CIPAW_06G117000 [Carya illinoinensis]|uniref:Uncharacterized protein n=1 Tax=Carya illinoinensis TaxID=32201 RepID=A0A8T1QAT1_CARIL|nr:hypothetical protein CIPAW_06G117000 [Carya illinoinensis]
MTYSNKVLSQGNLIGPLLGSPNSSSDILKSSLKTFLLRYSKGTTNLLLSVVYTTKWPLLATEDCKPTSLFGHEILLGLLAVILCHFFAIGISLFGLIMAAA